MEVLDAEDIAALRAEGALQASLSSHPGVARVLGVAVDAAAQRYGIVMKLYETAVDRDAEVAPLLALARVARVAQGLAFLHGQPRPVVHGDVKPANILLALRGGADVALTDFGLCVGRSAPLRWWPPHAPLS